jgi:conjugative transfer signal peptidase TraF
MAGGGIALTAAAALMLTGVGTEYAHRAGWRVNLTASEPRGFYRLRPIGSSPVPRGALVALCPPPWVTPAVFPFYMTGDCPGGGRTLLKTVVGIPGDRIEASLEGVRINGVLLPDSAPMRRSDRYPEIRLPEWHGAIVLGSRQYWVYGRGARQALAARSFDSRYFGPVSASELRGRTRYRSRLSASTDAATQTHSPADQLAGLFGMHETSKHQPRGVVFSCTKQVCEWRHSQRTSATPLDSRLRRTASLE